MVEGSHMRSITSLVARFALFDYQSVHLLIPSRTTSPMSHTPSTPCTNSRFDLICCQIPLETLNRAIRGTWFGATRSISGNGIHDAATMVVASRSTGYSTGSPSRSSGYNRQHTNQLVHACGCRRGRLVPASSITANRFQHRGRPAPAPVNHGCSMGVEQLIAYHIHHSPPLVAPLTDERSTINCGLSIAAHGLQNRSPSSQAWVW